VTGAARTRTVVITGASAGVGRATARAFAELGSNVAVLARGRDGLDATLKELESIGVDGLALRVDVSDAEAVEAAAERVEQQLGEIDVWINNAMATVFAPVTEITADEFKRATEVTYLGQVYGTLAALRHMQPRDRGTIVNVGSALAYRGIPLQAPYCAAKFACRGFTEAVRAELLHDESHVRIAMVHLPAVNTPQFSWSRSKMPRHPHPVPPIYQPERAADAIVRAALEPGPDTELGPWTALVIWASKWMPNVLDHFVARSAFESQQTDRLVPDGRAGNLFEPLDRPGGGDHGAHGIFDRQSHGLADPFFLRQIPSIGAHLGRAITDRFGFGGDGR